MRSWLWCTGRYYFIIPFIMQAANCLYLITMTLVLSCIYHLCSTINTPCIAHNMFSILPNYHCQCPHLANPQLLCCYWVENHYIVPRKAPESTRGIMFCSCFEMQCLGLMWLGDIYVLWSWLKILNCYWYWVVVHVCEAGWKQQTDVCDK